MHPHDTILKKIKDQREKHQQLVHLINNLLHTVLYAQTLALEIKTDIDDLLIQLNRSPEPVLSPTPGNQQTSLDRRPSSPPTRQSPLPILPPHRKESPDLFHITPPSFYNHPLSPSPRHHQPSPLASPEQKRSKQQSLTSFEASNSLRNPQQQHQQHNRKRAETPAIGKWLSKKNNGNRKNKN